MKYKAAVLFLMLITNTLMILGTQVEGHLSAGKKKAAKETEKDGTPDFLFFASKWYL